MEISTRLWSSIIEVAINVSGKQTGLKQVTMEARMQTGEACHVSMEFSWDTWGCQLRQTAKRSAGNRVKLQAAAIRLADRK